MWECHESFDLRSPAHVYKGGFTASYTQHPIQCSFQQGQASLKGRSDMTVQVTYRTGHMLVATKSRAHA
jgi:hypothetical protein